MYHKSTATKKVDDLQDTLDKKEDTNTPDVYNIDKYAKKSLTQRLLARRMMTIPLKISLTQLLKAMRLFAVLLITSLKLQRTRLVQ